MNKVKKIFSVIERKCICILNYISPKLYMDIYYEYLKKIGIKMGKVRPNYIDPSAYFDGVDYSLISVGEHSVISKDVLILTHDYSIFRALNLIGKEDIGKRILGPISIGNNCFIGARAILLPGTTIADNVIVGAGSVVKGIIPEGVVIAGNPAKVINRTEEYAYSWIESNER